jgi:hypothetical protein
MYTHSQHEKTSSEGPASAARASRELTPAQRESLLRASWMYHDYQWFRFVGDLLGFEGVNRPNQDILERMSCAEMRRLMRALRIASVEGMDTLVHLLAVAGELYVADLCPMTLEVDGDAFLLKTDTCFAHEGTLRAGLAPHYRCGPMQRVSGWLRGMGVGFEVTPGIGLCLLSQGKACSYRVQVRFPGS